MQLAIHFIPRMFQAGQFPPPIQTGTVLWPLLNDRHPTPLVISLSPGLSDWLQLQGPTNDNHMKGSTIQHATPGKNNFKNTHSSPFAALTFTLLPGSTEQRPHLKEHYWTKFQSILFISLLQPEIQHTLPYSQPQLPHLVLFKRRFLITVQSEGLWPKDASCIFKIA